MSEGMEVCLDVCRKCSVSTEGLGVATSPGLHLLKKPTVEAPQVREAGDETLNAGGRRKVKLSRHFYETRSEDVPQPPRPELPDVAHIAVGLSHGCVNAMNLVVEASRIQSENNPRGVSCPTFDVTKVVTCVLPGLPEEHACVLQGCVLLVSDEQASVAHRLKERHLKVALITGDLSDTYRHLGFKRLKGVRCVRDRSHCSSSNKEEEWLEETVTLLLNLEVNLVVVSGLAGDNVIQRCCRHHVLVVDKAKAPVLKALASATGAVPVTYATQLSRRCVGAGAKAAIWRELRSRQGKPSTTVNISTVESGGGLVTVILTSHVDAKLQALEDQFWACAYRLHHVLKGKVLLPGAGVTEMLCVHRLQKEAELHVEPGRGRDGDGVRQTKAGTAASPYRALVLRLMADGLIDYVTSVMVNTGRFSKVRARTAVSRHLQAYAGSPGIAAEFSRLFLAGEREDGGASPPVESRDPPAEQVYDSLSVKQEAWRKALDLVLLVLQTDAEVITGIDPKTDGAQDKLMLL
uniref:Bardet-Biedl syndrome 12 n=2 Tax=Cyclopterus lumpus TaxID=8103 RepID=A0A8C2ZEG8_CYCLU